MLIKKRPQFSASEHVSPLWSVGWYLVEWTLPANLDTSCNLHANSCNMKGKWATAISASELKLTHWSLSWDSVYERHNTETGRLENVGIQHLTLVPRYARSLQFRPHNKFKLLWDLLQEDAWEVHRHMTHSARTDSLLLRWREREGDTLCPLRYFELNLHARIDHNDMYYIRIAWDYISDNSRSWVKSSSTTVCHICIKPSRCILRP